MSDKPQTIVQYNQDLEKGNAEIEAGELTTAFDLKAEKVDTPSWHIGIVKERLTDYGNNKDNNSLCSERTCCKTISLVLVYNEYLKRLGICNATHKRDAIATPC